MKQALPQTVPLPWETERLQLREWGTQDAPWVFQLNEDPEVIRYTGDKSFNSMDEAVKLLRSYHNYKEHGFGRWAVTLKHTHKPIGWCGLKQNDWGVDLGFRFFREHWGKGYATEAAQASLHIAQQLKLEKVWGRTLVQNQASLRVLEKIGMSLVQHVPFATFARDHNVSSEELDLWKEEVIALYAMELTESEG